MRKIVILALLNICLAFKLSLNCESLKEEDANNSKESSPQLLPISSTTSTTMKEPELINIKGLTKAENCASGGNKINLSPSYLGHVYGTVSKHKPTDLEHGRLSGFTLHLDNKHQIIHHDSFIKVHSSRGADHEHGQVLQPAPTSISSNFRGWGARLPNDPEQIQEHLGGSQFHLAKLGLQHTTRHEQVTPPKLEKNKNEFGTNCYMLAYSTGVAGSSQFDDHSIEKTPKLLFTPAGQTQQLAMFHVKRVGDKCDNGRCKLIIDPDKHSSGHYCSHIQDKGAPILCGHEKKVTYLAQGGDGQCGASFSAFHVPHMISDIEKHVKLAN